MNVTFRELEESEVESCAGWLTASEPWITLGFDQAKSEWALRRVGLEKWVAVDTENTPVGIAVLKHACVLVDQEALTVLCLELEDAGIEEGALSIDERDGTVADADDGVARVDRRQRAVRRSDRRELHRP